MILFLEHINEFDAQFRRHIILIPLRKKRNNDEATC